MPPTQGRAAAGGPLMQEEDLQLWKAALHEAGHAVVAAVCRIPVRQARVKIVDGEGVGFSTSIFGHYPVKSRSHIERVCRMSYAGMFAERHAYGSDVDEAGARARSDIEEIYELVSRHLELPLDHPDCRAFADECAYRAFALVDDHIEAVIEVANVLFERRVISGKRIREIVRSHRK